VPGTLSDAEYEQALAIVGPVVTKYGFNASPQRLHDTPGHTTPSSTTTRTEAPFNSAVMSTRCSPSPSAAISVPRPKARSRPTKAYVLKSPELEQTVLAVASVAVTHVDAHWREMPISAATWASGRVWHRATSRRRPSRDSGALRWCMDGSLCSADELVALLILPLKDPSLSSGPHPRHQRHDPQHPELKMPNRRPINLPKSADHGAAPPALPTPARQGRLYATGTAPSSTGTDQAGDHAQGLSRQRKSELVRKGLEALGGLLTHISIMPRASPIAQEQLSNPVDWVTHTARSR
jgi:hypothetical protein